MERAYSVVTITKSATAERTVEGVASVPSLDRQGDIVESKGIRWRKLANGMPDVPWLMQHRHDEPIGHVEWLSAKPDGLRFRARMPKVDSPPTLKERLDTAYAELATGLVRGISIGFMPLKAEPIDTGWRFKEISLYEISSVTIPACEEACVEVVKRYDEAARRGEVASAGIESGRLARMMLDRGMAAIDAEAKDQEAAGEKYQEIGAGGYWASLVQSSTREMLEFLADRIEGIERRFDEQGRAYKGVWKDGRTYPAGTFITHSGSCWWAEKATDRRPGEGDWVLAVKRGADAR